MHTLAQSDEEWRSAFIARVKVPAVNRRGQPLRSDGAETRLRILGETLKLLRERPFAEVTMANVCKGLSLNAAAFYRYFADIGEALLALHEVVADDFAAILPILNDEQMDTDAQGQILNFLDQYFELWRQHAALLLARNSLAEARDARFMECRREFALSVNRRLAAKMTEAHPKVTADRARARASLVMMALERSVSLAVTNMYDSRELWPVTRQSLAEMIGEMVTQ